MGKMHAPRKNKLTGGRAQQIRGALNETFPSRVEKRTTPKIRESQQHFKTKAKQRLQTYASSAYKNLGNKGGQIIKEVGVKLLKKGIKHVGSKYIKHVKHHLKKPIY